MMQFNEQFVRRYMIPLLTEIFADMGAEPGKEGKGRYLKKLLALAPLEVREKERFRLDYFPMGKKAVRPFCEDTPDDENAREKILNTIAETIRTRIKLSGPTGMRTALLPTEERHYGANEDLTRNLYRLAYSMTLSFEQDRIKAKIGSGKKEGEMSGEEKKKYLKLLEDLENGKLRLMEINGEEQFMTEEEVNTAAGNPAYAGITVTPFVESGLWEKLEKDVAAGVVTGGEATEAPATQSTIADLRRDFRKTKADAIQKKLEESGLEVEGDVDVDEDGKARARVKDRNGQELSVLMDTNAPDSDARKYTFGFKGGALDGKTFTLSQNDLTPSFIDEAGRRRSAEEVYKRKLETEKPHEAPAVTPEAPGGRLSAPPFALAGLMGGGVPEGKLPVTAKGELPPEKATIRGKMKPGEMPVARKKEEEEEAQGLIPEGAKVRAPVRRAPVGGVATVQGRKKKVAEKPRVGAPSAPAGVPAGAPGGPGLLAARGAGKGRVPGFIKAIAGAGAGAGAGIGAGAWWAISSDSSQVAHVVHFIAGCIGSICLS